MVNSPLVSIIVVNWNGAKVLKNCLESISKIEYRNWELVVVDNGSTDQSNKLYESLKLKNKKIIKNEKNLGYAKANNQGFRKASGKYILLLNNDTKVKKDFLTILVSYLEKNPEVGVVQPKIALMDNPQLLDNSGAFLTSTGFLEHWGYMAKDSEEFNQTTQVFSTKGACMLIRKELVEKIGLFDEDFGSYFEETDFCWRVWLTGRRVIFYPKTKIYHKVGFSSKKQDQYFVNYHSNKNRFASLIKNLELSNLITIGGFHLFLNLTLSVYYLLKLQFNKSLMIWKAVGWNILNINTTLNKRFKIQKLRRKKDEEIFPIIMHKTDWNQMFNHFAKVEANFK